jgi:hypothetical protein
MNPQGPEQVKDLLSKIKEAAEKATPGPWQELHNTAGPMGIITGQDGELGPHPTRICWLEINNYEHANATFISLANPQAILSLLEKVKEAEARWNTLKDNREIWPLEVRDELAAFEERHDVSVCSSQHLTEWVERCERAEAALSALKREVEQAAEWFEEYAEHHQAKAALDKASRNLERANHLRRSLALLSGRAGGSSVAESGSTASPKSDSEEDHG